MTDLIREAAERTVAAIDGIDPIPMTDELRQILLGLIEAALREKFTGAGLEEVLSCIYTNCYDNTTDKSKEIHHESCPAYYRPTVAALIEARVAAARRGGILAVQHLIDSRICMIDDRIERSKTTIPNYISDQDWDLWWSDRCVLSNLKSELVALASSGPGSEVSK